MVGLFVFIGLVFLAIGILTVGNLHETFTKKMRLAAMFDDVAGLQAGNNVWFSGVKIGTVKDLQFYGQSQVEVSLKIDSKVRKYIRKDAKVKIGTDGLIGNKILIIYGGTPAAAVVMDGDTLAVEKTFSSEDMINMLQENNKNLLAITTDFKSISHKIDAGEGTIGKLLNDNTLYNNMDGTIQHLDATILTIKGASVTAQKLVSSLSDYSAGLNKPGTFANQLVTDTVIFNSVKSSVLQLQAIADTAKVLISTLKKAGANPRTTVGVLLHDEEAGKILKSTMKNLESSSLKLDEDLEAVQHNILLRRFFKQKAKAAKSEEIKK